MVIEIPGRDSLHIKNIVLDFNGTLANNGIISEEAKNILKELAGYYELFVLTADTYGNAAEACSGLPVVLKTFPNERAGAHKLEVIEELNSEHCACVGNGYNDINMFSKAALTIGVLGEEGICGKLVQNSDIIVNSIEDGLELFLDTKKITATLRA